MKKPSGINGFTMTEALLALMVCLLVSSLACGFLMVTLRFSLMENDHQNQFGILQIREILAAARNVQVTDNEITFISDCQEYSLSFDRNRLVKKPGYEILLIQVEEGSFLQENSEIYLLVENRKIQLR